LIYILHSYIVTFLKAELSYTCIILVHCTPQSTAGCINDEDPSPGGYAKPGTLNNNSAAENEENLLETDPCNGLEDLLEILTNCDYSQDDTKHDNEHDVNPEEKICVSVESSGEVLALEPV
jgi:hypothetical protein